MDKIKYLKELQKTGELPNLLGKLGIPSKEYKGFRRGCSISFTNEKLTIDKWDHDFSSSYDYEESVYELNDFMFISGINDPKQERLQTLFDFMTNRFPETYKKDCVAYLHEMQEEEKAKVEAKYSTIASKLNKE